VASPSPFGLPVKKKPLIVTAVAAVLAAAWWVAITPDNVVLRRWRARQQDLTAKVIIGPYPLERDFATLKQRGVTLIICLLNPELPYERHLLAQERAAAAKAGIELRNFPMTSLWGREVGDHSAKNAQAAAKAAREAPGKVYLHCYLGIHRARNVADLIAGQTTITQMPNKVERTAQRRVLDEADAAYHRGNYAETLRLLQTIEQPGADVHALRGWSHFKLGNLDAAGEAFRAASFAAPGDAAPLVGLGYVALRRNDLAVAEESFRRALVLAPKDVDALTGGGITAFRQGHSADAAALLERAVALDPNNRDAADALQRARQAAGTHPLPAVVQ